MLRLSAPVQWRWASQQALTLAWLLVDVAAAVGSGAADMGVAVAVGSGAAVVEVGSGLSADSHPTSSRIDRAARPSTHKAQRGPICAAFPITAPPDVLA